MLITPHDQPVLPPSDDEVSGPHVGPPAPVARKAPTPDPEARWWTQARHSGAVAPVATNPIPDEPPAPIPDEAPPVPDETAPMPDLQAPTTPDTQPQQGNAAALLGALATPGPDGQAPLGKLVGLTGGPLAVVLLVLVWGYFMLTDQTKTVVNDAMTRQAAEHKLEREREKIEEERRLAAQDSAHAKLHDQERRDLDARLDKLLQVVERQEAKLDDLSSKVGELQPKRR